MSRPGHAARAAGCEHDRGDAQSLVGSLAEARPFASTKDIPFSILLPAFVTSELKTAFQIGFLIFLPFLIIDLIVASTLMALGMMMGALFDRAFRKFAEAFEARADEIYGDEGPALTRA